MNVIGHEAVGAKIQTESASRFRLSISVTEEHDQVLSERASSPSADPIFRHDFLVQIDPEARFFRHGNVAVYHRKCLLCQVFTQIALFDAILEVVRVRQGGDEVQAGGDVDACLD